VSDQNSIAAIDPLGSELVLVTVNPDKEEVNKEFNILLALKEMGKETLRVVKDISLTQTSSTSQNAQVNSNKWGYVQSEYTLKVTVEPVSILTAVIKLDSLNNNVRYINIGSALTTIQLEQSL